MYDNTQLNFYSSWRQRQDTSWHLDRLLLRHRTCVKTLHTMNEFVSMIVKIGFNKSHPNLLPYWKGYPIKECGNLNSDNMRHASWLSECLCSAGFKFQHPSSENCYRADFLCHKVLNTLNSPCNEHKRTFHFKQMQVKPTNLNLDSQDESLRNHIIKTDLRMKGHINRYH